MHSSVWRFISLGSGVLTTLVLSGCHTHTASNMCVGCLYGSIDSSSSRRCVDDEAFLSIFSVQTGMEHTIRANHRRRMWLVSF